MIGRRDFLAGSAALGSALALPAIGRAEASRVLKFIPQSDVTVLDPIWTTAYVTRNHGFMLFDTLYGFDAAYRPQPQMVEGHAVEADGKLWKLTLRDGLMFHDGQKVLARDCVASIQRWGKRDSYGQTLLALTDEISAPDDRTIQFRLKQPFALLPEALGKPGSNFCAIMPERLAQTDPFKQVPELIGSGPFRFKADERVVGSRVVYEKFAGYKPREGGKASLTAGPKMVHFDRVEWHVIPDQATAAAALQAGEFDWWENPTSDMLPLLRQSGTLRVEIADPAGQMACMRLNELHPPFDNPAIRRALLKAVNQEDFMIAVAGTDPSLWRVPTGVFCPDTPMASDVGLEVFTAPRDFAAVKREIKAAGYNGEKVVLLAPTDFPILKALADVGADTLQKIGFNVDCQAMDWGTVVQRRAKKEPIDQGGWSLFHTFWQGLDQMNPVGHAFLRGNGASALFGWPNSPKIEELRQNWIAAPDLPAQQAIARQLQQQALIDVPYVPLGQNFYDTAYRPDITGVLSGFVMFWNVRRE
jgi:peptide/nickel transport system substrate-binding protein